MNSYWAFTPEEAIRALNRVRPLIMYRRFHLRARPPVHVGPFLHVHPILVSYLRERAA